MRLHPPAYLVGRYTVRDLELDHGKIEVSVQRRHMPAERMPWQAK